MTAGVFEAFLGVGEDGRGVVLYDVSAELVQHENKRFKSRAVQDIRRQYVHHSGALRGGDPFEHMKASARYVVEHRGWPGFAYHVWHPYQDCFDHSGDRVVYRGNLDTTCTYHAGAAPNRKGFAHCLQGNLSRREMSDAQASTLPVALSFFAKRFGITPNPIGHFQAEDGHAKPTCPGTAGKAWVLGYQSGYQSRQKEKRWT